MQKIEIFDEVLYQLRNREILFTVEKGRATYFVQTEENRIRVKNDHVNYFISIEQLKQLFAFETFYLYENDKRMEEVVSDAKDEEYYNWKHK